MKACMIDGFGWFRHGDYLRSWLFFDAVDYILPKKTNPSLDYPPQVYLSPEYQVVHTELDEPLLRALVLQSAQDAEEPAYRQLIEAEVPAADRDYALAVVRGDAELNPHVTDALGKNTVFAVAFLVNKLLLHSAMTGALPIFGRRYGTAVLMNKMAHIHPAPRRISYSAFAAGLSLAFLSEEKLAKLPFEILSEFKTNHLSLLKRNQKQLIKVAESYEGLPEGPGFDEHLEHLRQEVEREREHLETQARIAWQHMGQDIARSAVVATSTTFLTGLAVMRGGGFADLLGAGLSAMVAGVGTAAAFSLETLAKIREAKRHSMAYLFEVSKVE